jgi:hypothetical protein
MPDITPQHVDVIVQHPGLLKLYVDRIMAKNDKSRVGDPRINTAVRAALGHFTHLAANLTAELASAS